TVDQDFDAVGDACDLCVHAFDPSNEPYVDDQDMLWPNDGQACNGDYSPKTTPGAMCEPGRATSVACTRAGSPGTRREPGAALERAANRRLRGVADLGGDLCQRAGAGRQARRSELHSPAEQVVHRRGPETFGEALGQHRPRHSGFPGNVADGPILARSRVQGPKRASDPGIAKSGQPPGPALGQLLGVATDHLD